MSVRLLIAPSSAGKTEYVLRLARASVFAAAESAEPAILRSPILVVPTPIQAQSARERLAILGGVLGLRTLTFDGLYQWILVRSGIDAIQPPNAAQFRLMQGLLAGLAKEGLLRHYQGIAHTPGLATRMLDLVAELQNARVEPESLMAFWTASSAFPGGAPDRLHDIAVLYDAWERLLVRHGFTDRAGMGAQALNALNKGRFALDVSASPIYVDGFDFLTELQLQVVAALANLPGVQMIVTLTGDLSAPVAPTTSGNRFEATRLRLEEALGVRAEALPESESNPATDPTLREVRRRLNRREYGGVPIVDATSALTMLEASQRATEVRAALRWLKRKVVVDGSRPADCALLVRDSTVWQAIILQVAAEFGVPVRLVGGIALEENPAIVALLALLKIALPEGSGAPTFFRADLVALLRSPYFDLSPLGVHANEASRLDTFGRGALVVGGTEAWRAAFSAALTALPEEVDVPVAHSEEEQDGNLSAAPYTRADVKRLSAFFERFVARLTPPARAPMREQIAWLEELLEDAKEVGQGGLGFISSLRAGAESERDRDENALLAFKDLLRGLLFSAEQLGAPPISYAEFLREVGGALEGTRYDIPAAPDAVFCGTTIEARGLPFAHVALLGMVEGELPQRTQDDPFLRDEDRVVLRERFHGVQRSAESQEREYFVEALSRAEASLLLARSVIGENGAAAEPSPYWVEMKPWLAGAPLSERFGALPDAALAASMPELMQSLAQNRHAAAEGWVAFRHAETLRTIDEASRILRLRSRRERSVYDGDLRDLPALVDAHFPVRRDWSPTAFESWLTCPFFFLASRHLHLEPPVEPEAEVDRATLGSIYHEILRALYAPGVEPATALERLDEVAETLLAGAPASFHFLNTPIWQQQAAEMRANLRKSVVALAELEGVPIAVEQRYRDGSALQVTSEAGAFRIRGVVDRIDALPDGSLRIIDYKTGKGEYDSAQALAQGKRLQLPLYALLVENTLGKDKVGDGIYFFVHTGEAARWSLAGYTGGIEGATEIALNWARRAVKGIRAGDFVPTPPADGCPDYCPATAFCWHYKPSGYRR